MDDQRLQLTIHLERSGDELTVYYYDAKLQSLVETPERVAWSSLGAEYSYVRDGKTLRGIEAVGAVLEDGDLEALLGKFTQSRLVEVGHLFFKILLGNSQRWEPVLRQLFDEHEGPRPNPPRHSVRVRIYTTIDELVDLPWRVAAWKGKFLSESGWTFEVTADTRPRRDIDFETPCAVLVIAPQHRDMVDIHTDEHVEALKQALPAQYLTPGYFRIARTREQVRDAFLGMRPSVLYYYGHAGIRGGQMCMFFGEPDDPEDPVNAHDLKNLMGGSYPHLAYINACKSGASGWYSGGYQLSPDVPVVIANATTSWSNHAGLSAIGWLSKVLEHGHDPVIAAHALDDLVTTRGFEWGMRTVHANYGVWRANPLASLGPVMPIGLRLDRERSRERVFSRISALVRSDEHRVIALVAYAKKGNRIDLQIEQFQDHLEDHASHLAHISWRNVTFPKEREVDAPERMYAALQRDLARSLEAAPSEPVEFALRRCARGLGVGTATPIVWLNWGVFGQDHGQLIGLQELKYWIEYCSQLAQRTPADFRVVCYLAFETGKAPHEVLEKAVNNLALRHITDESFSVDLIPPLPDLGVLDIATFLQNRDNSRCPANLVHEMAQRLHDKTQGNYEKTLEYIEEAEKEGWYSMRRKLLGPEESSGIGSGLIQ